MHIFDSTIIIFYLLFILYLGIRASKKSKSFSEFSIGSGNYSKWAIFATLTASFIGGGYILGNAAKVYSGGLVHVTALLGFSLSQILVAIFIAPKMKNFKAMSVGDIFESRFGKKGKLISGISSLIVCAGIIGAQVGAIGYVFNQFMGLPYMWGAILGCSIVILYSTFGGIHAVIVTDILQFIFLAIAIPLLIIFGFIYLGNSVESIENIKISSSHLHLFGSDIKSNLILFLLFCSFLFGEVLVPPYLQRLLITKNMKHLKKGTMMSGIFSVPLFFLSGLAGIFALALNSKLVPDQSIPYLIDQALPIGIKGFVIAGIISVIMSSVDSFLNAAAVTVIHDIITPLKKQPFKIKEKLFYTRLATIATGVIAILFTFHVEGVINILLYAYQFWSPIILVPLVAILLNKPTSTKSFFVGASSGILAMVLWNHFLYNKTGVSGISTGVIAHFIGYYLTERVLALKESWLIRKYQ